MIAKRVCLVNTPWSVMKGSIWAYVRSTMPPLGVLVVGAVLEENGHEIDMVDFQSMVVDWDDIEKIVSEWDYGVFGITATTSIVNNC